ncbi:single-stranded DNA-binding protein [Candidatus Fermentibacteria bacterium]|nr:single-stranded DNA-binding protein [Candidatus Fermentibacteria bacterium]
MADLRLPSLNFVQLTGRLTRDPEMRYTPSGVAVATFGIAVNRYYKDSSGESREETSFFTIVAWQKLAERVAELAHKGSSVLVEGRLHSRTWESSDGQRHSVIEIHAQRLQMLSKAEGDREYAPPPPEREAFDEPVDDEMPF